MKTLNLLSKCFALSIVLLVTAGGKTNAQDCKNYYYMSNNTEVEMTMYDKNGAKSGLQQLILIAKRITLNWGI